MTTEPVADVVVIGAGPAGSATALRLARAGHQVTVLDQGVLYREKHYRSLSEVAREITGTRWSGPRFFGLNSNPKAAFDGAK